MNSVLLALCLFLPQDPVEVVVTANAHEEDALESAWSIDTVGGDILHGRARTMTDALRGLPSVMLQQTAHGQSSPFIRGLTGYHNVLLVDGIRLNHSAFRAGPNQYWSTIDPYAVAGLELVRGPNSVLYGSDAIGGTLNARSAVTDTSRDTDSEWEGLAHLRWSSAEDSFIERLETTHSNGQGLGFRVGTTHRNFGDLTAGGPTGLQPGTGYTDGAGDFRLDRRLDSGALLTFAAQSFRQQDVPRTHKTEDGIPFHGTTPGGEHYRLHDQVRDLVYTRLGWDERGGWMDRGELTLSLHHHDETRQRSRDRSGQVRVDHQGFEVFDYALNARFGAVGGWDWGAEFHHEQVDSFKKEWRDGASQPDFIQGPLADDSRVQSAALYIQKVIQTPTFTFVPGLRTTHTNIHAGKVEDPDTGLETELDRDWTSTVGSMRGIWWTGENSQVFAGLSQGFRTPSLYDLTSLDETSVEETPEFDLEPERFLQLELGTKGREQNMSWQVSGWRTWIDDMIMRSPEASIGSAVGKDNSDGWMHGLEAAFTWTLTPEWTTRLQASWMDGEVDQRVGEDGVAFEDLRLVRAPVDRLIPLQLYAAVRRTFGSETTWVEGSVWGMADADKLSFRDERDGGRIPAGGTPGFTTMGLSAGHELRDGLTLELHLDNLTHQDYRVHGSGINGPGRNLVFALRLRF
ncbi:MAG: TonB-dependent receptor [Planctomycetes bacterium]|nr:TonB-dependent receptor [Planctomycetota bacterium]